MFDDWYDRTVTVHVPGGVDEWGATVPGSDVVVPCYISEDVQLVRSPQGEEVASSTTVHAALEWAGTFEPDTAVEFDSPAGHRTAQVISVSVGVGDDDLDGIAVHLT